MMPGHEDREDGPDCGDTCPPVVAAMMPGHEDREDDRLPGLRRARAVAAMMPGHEDREDRTTLWHVRWCPRRRNDARSRRPGRHTERSSMVDVTSGRNDARSRRPGRLGAAADRAIAPVVPQ